MPLNGEMFPVALLTELAAGSFAGLAYGSAAAWGKRRITARELKKSEEGAERTGILRVLGISGLRMLVNIAAFAVLFILREGLPFPFAPAAAGTAVGLTGEIWMLTARRRGKGRQPDEAERR